MSVPLWDFTGTTLVTTNHIRLTSDHQSMRGAIWNNVVSESVQYYVGYYVHIIVQMMDGQSCFMKGDFDEKYCDRLLYDP